MHCPKCATSAGWEETWDGEEEEVWRTVDCECGIDLDDFCDCDDLYCGDERKWFGMVDDIRKNVEETLAWCAHMDKTHGAIPTTEKMRHLAKIVLTACKWASMESTPDQAGTIEGIAIDMKAAVASAILQRKGPGDD